MSKWRSSFDCQEDEDPPAEEGETAIYIYIYMNVRPRKFCFYISPFLFLVSASSSHNLPPSGGVRTPKSPRNRRKRRNGQAGWLFPG